MAADNNSAQQSLPEELRKEGTQPPRSQEPSKKKATPKWLIKLAAFLALFAGFVCWKLFGIVGLLVALAYALLSGYSVPAQRTVYMLATVAGALKKAGVKVLGPVASAGWCDRL